MKNIILLLSIVISTIILDGCHKGLCDGLLHYYPISSDVNNYIYKRGSYWVYRDSASGNVDSMYAYYYKYQVHVPGQEVYAGGTIGSQGTDCGSDYIDINDMCMQRFQNGILKDTLCFIGFGADAANAGFLLNEQLPVNNQLSGISIFLNWTTLGYLKLYSNVVQNGTNYDTIGTWYNGVLPTVTSGAYTFTNVRSWGVELNNRLSSFFAYRTDIYITSGAGIIKMVQHLPTGDVKWDLINYHIAP